MTLADRVRALFMARKPSYGTVDTDESLAIVGRRDARHYIRGSGPYQHFTAEPRRVGSPWGERRGRKKRAAARERARGAA